ncbi:MAG: CinA family protein [Ruminococcus sp.]|nr:CinA family protein [Ruminococcus sp.]MCD7772797.1 CinA family protein [Ruminococcus sp.]
MKNDKNDKLITNTIDRTAIKVVKWLTEHGLTISLAESCTGGMLSEAITSVSGASEVYECGICSYSNRIKQSILGVNSESLEKYGAVSEQVAREMANGVLRLSQSDIAVGVTGIAGPLGGTEEKPVGTVWVSVATKEKTIAKNLMLYNRGVKLERETVRQYTTYEALEMVLQAPGA